MNKKPIIFSAPMVRAILEGRKTQTRRVIKPQPKLEPAHDGFPDFWHWHLKGWQWADGGLGMPESAIEDYAPYKPGGILWVRETWAESNGDELPKGYYYKADCKDATIVSRWRPSIHMPRKAARLFLEVKSVRVERLRDISEEDAEAEGVFPFNMFDQIKFPAGSPLLGRTYKNGFMSLWDTLNAKRGFSWDSNPWVWVIEFERRK